MKFVLIPASLTNNRFLPPLAGWAGSAGAAFRGCRGLTPGDCLSTLRVADCDSRQPCGLACGAEGEAFIVKGQLS